MSELYGSVAQVPTKALSLVQGRTLREVADMSDIVKVIRLARYLYSIYPVYPGALHCPYWEELPDSTRERWLSEAKFIVRMVQDE